MIFNIKNIIKKTLAILLIAVVGVLIANKGFNLHSHKLDSGKIVTHSHPFNKDKDSSPFKSHHHTNIEFLVLENIGLLFFIVFLTIALLSLFREKIVYTYRKNNRLKLLPNSYPGRAPPLLQI